MAAPLKACPDGLADVAGCVAEELVRGVRVDEDAPVSAATIELDPSVGMSFVLAKVESAAVGIASVDSWALVIVEASFVLVAMVAEASKVVLAPAARVG